LVQLKPSGGGIEAAEIYLSSKLPTAIGGAIELNGYLYGTNTGSLICADFATGEIKWQDGSSIKVGSLLYADGRLYWHGQETGEVALVEATPDAYREKGKFTPPEMPTRRSADEKMTGKAWAYPVVANGRLYIRDWNCLWCYDVQAK
jgi:outer membrane protein assembly factor BamB